MQIVSAIFSKICYMSIIGTIIASFLFCITQILENKLSAKSKCFILLIPILFLMIPIGRIPIQVDKDYTISAVMDKVENTLSYQDMQQEIQANIKQEQEWEQASLNRQGEKDLNSIRFKELSAGVWLLGTILGMSVFIIQKMRLGYKIAQAQSIKDNRLTNILEQCIVKLKLNRKIKIKLQTSNQSPYIYGAFRPKILISKEILEKEDSIIENVFMHELAHYKRKDILTNYILLLVTILHWFNPFVHILFKKMRQEMELATDEVALSKMEKEKKKQYGFTLLSLLQTYEKERVKAKMLCMADDSKNMERRIKKIKLSMKQKKYKVSILCFTMILTMGILSPFVVKAVNLNEDKLYDKVEQYLMVAEEKRLAEVEKEASINENVEIGLNFKTFIDMKKLGIRQNKEEIYVYVWVVVEKYYTTQDGERLVENESCKPYKFTIKQEQIINCEFPEEEEEFSKSIEELFPEEMHTQLQEYIEEKKRTKIVESRAEI